MSNTSTLDTVDDGGSDAPPETPTGIASTLSAMLAEMKQMNERWNSSLGATVDGASADPASGEEDGESGSEDDADHVGVDSLVNQLTTNDGASANLLDEIAQDLDISEKTGDSVNEDLAKILSSLLKDKIPEEKVQEKINKYPRPANVEGLQTPRINPLIWSQLPAPVRTQDSKSQKLQNALLASIVSTTKAVDLLLKHKSGMSDTTLKETVTYLTDAIALSMQSFHDVSNSRRQAMKKDLHKDYAALCSSSTVPLSSEYLFGDLAKLTKDITEANKLTKKVRPQSHGNSRGKKQGQGSNYRQNYSSGNGNRRYHPYQKSRSDFL